VWVLAWLFLHTLIQIPVEMFLTITASTMMLSWLIHRNVVNQQGIVPSTKSPFPWGSLQSKVKEKNGQENGVILGCGSSWLAEHSYRLHESRDPKEGMLLTPARHTKSKRIEIPARLLSRNGLALGSPGSGKTQLLVLLAHAAQRRGESVWFIDPKGSPHLYQQIREGALGAGHPFFALIPQRPEVSVQYDPLRYCLSGTDIATRLVSLIPGEKQDVFKHFCWGVLVTLSEACLLLGESPSISKLSNLLPEAGESLLPRVIRYLERQEHAELKNANDFNISNAIKNSLLALIHHDRAHYQKMTVPLRSVFELFSRGALGKVIGGSEYQSQGISLDILSARLQCATVYIGLDALVNPHVAKAMAALVLEDIAADAARRIRGDSSVPPQLLLVDEAGEVACEALLQLLGKGRECGVQTWFAIQTLSDLEWRLGGAAAARVAEGNAGAWFLFRQLDAVSRRESERRLGTLPIARRSASVGTSSSRRMGAHYQSDSVSDGFTREMLPRIPESVFSCLEDLECFAHLPDGSLFHLRLAPSF